jgi:hypothetical protein
MANRTSLADHLRTTDKIIDFACRAGQHFSVEMARPLHRAYVGSVHVGFLEPETLGVVRWPEIIPPPRPYHEMLHQQADRARTNARCYFIGGAEGPVKIGFSVDVDSRLSAIRSCSPVPLGILALAPGGQEREIAYHQQFADHRLHGEWFARVPEIEAEIARLSEGAA